MASSITGSAGSSPSWLTQSLLNDSPTSPKPEPFNFAPSTVEPFNFELSTGEPSTGDAFKFANIPTSISLDTFKGAVPNQFEATLSGGTNPTGTSGSATPFTIPQALTGHQQPVQVASTSSMSSVDGYGAGTGSRLLPVTGTQPGQKTISARQASDTLAEAYGLHTPAQKEAFAKLGLFTQPVQLHPVVQSVYMPLTIPPEMHNQLRSLASNIKTGQEQQQQADAASAQRAIQVASNGLDNGRFHTDRNKLYADLQNARVGKPEADELLRRNDQNVHKYLTDVRAGHSRGAFVDGLRTLTPDLVKSGYITQDQAQQMLDQNWLNWAGNAVLSGDPKAPSREEVNNKGYEIIARYSGATKDAFKQQVDDIKAQIQQRSAPPAPISAPVIPAAPAPVARTPVAPAPVASTPVASTPVASTPVASTPVASTPVARTPVAPAPVASTPVASTPVARTPVAPAPAAPALTAPAYVANEVGLPQVGAQQSGQALNGTLEDARNKGLLNTIYDDPNQPTLGQGQPEDPLQRMIKDFTHGFANGTPGAAGGLQADLSKVTPEQSNYAGSMSSAERFGIATGQTIGMFAPFGGVITEGAATASLAANPQNEAIYNRNWVDAAISTGANLAFEALPIGLTVLGGSRTATPDVRPGTPDVPNARPDTNEPTGSLNAPRTAVPTGNTALDGEFALPRRERKRPPAPVQLDGGRYDVGAVSENGSVRLDPPNSRDLHVPRAELANNRSVRFQGQEWISREVKGSNIVLESKSNPNLRVEVTPDQLNQLEVEFGQSMYKVGKAAHGVMELNPSTRAEPVVMPLNELLRQRGSIEARIKGYELNGPFQVSQQPNGKLQATGFDRAGKPLTLEITPEQIVGRHTEVPSNEFGVVYSDPFMVEESRFRSTPELRADAGPMGDPRLGALSNVQPEIKPGAAILEDMRRVLDDPNTKGDATLFNIAINAEGPEARAFADSVLRYAERGNKVKVYVHEALFDTWPSNQQLLQEFRNANIELVFPERHSNQNVVHAKGLVIKADASRPGADRALLTTAAFNNQSVKKQDLIVELPAEAASLLNDYMKLVTSSGMSAEQQALLSAAPNLSPAQRQSLIDGLRPNAAASAERERLVMELSKKGVHINDPRQQLPMATRAMRAVIENAEKTVHMRGSELTDPEITRIMIDKAKQGVDVRIQVRDVDPRSTQMIKDALQSDPGLKLSLENVGEWKPYPHHNTVISEKAGVNGTNFAWGPMDNLSGNVQKTGQSFDMSFSVTGEALEKLKAELAAAEALERARGQQ